MAFIDVLVYAYVKAKIIHACINMHSLRAKATFSNNNVGILRY